jgi:hypothetical protein
MQLKSGYAVVMEFAKAEPGWIPYVHSAHRVAQRSGEHEFTGSDILREMPQPAWAPGLKALARAGILEHVRSTRGGKRAWYRMPDLEGVARALAELGFGSV